MLEVQMPCASKRPWRRALLVIAVVAAWCWTLVAGVGGLLLLIYLGPLPLTNGWFAMFSGIAACPALPRLIEKVARRRVRWGACVVVAALIMAAGRVAVVIEGPRPPRPEPTTGVWKTLF
jgi:hypothetical protein